jgi:hypothetical protein
MPLVVDFRETKSGQRYDIDVQFEFDALVTFSFSTEKKLDEFLELTRERTALTQELRDLSNLKQMIVMAYTKERFGDFDRTNLAKTMRIINERQDILLCAMMMDETPAAAAAAATTTKIRQIQPIASVSSSTSTSTSNSHSSTNLDALVAVAEEDVKRTKVHIPREILDKARQTVPPPPLLRSGSASGEKRHRKSSPVATESQMEKRMSKKPEPVYDAEMYVQPRRQRKRSRAERETIVNLADNNGSVVNTGSSGNLSTASKPVDCVICSLECANGNAFLVHHSLVHPLVLVDFGEELSTSINEERDLFYVPMRSGQYYRPVDAKYCSRDEAHRRDQELCQSLAQKIEHAVTNDHCSQREIRRLIGVDTVFTQFIDLKFIYSTLVKMMPSYLHAYIEDEMEKRRYEEGSPGL